MARPGARWLLGQQVVKRIGFQIRSPEGIRRRIQGYIRSIECDSHNCWWRPQAPNVWLTERWHGHLGGGAAQGSLVCPLESPACR
jgi:hypothetical protein